VSPPSTHQKFGPCFAGNDPTEIHRRFRASNVEDGVGVLLGLEEGERGSCLLLGGERSGGIWEED